MLVALGAIDPGSNPGRPTIFHRTNRSRLEPPSANVDDDVGFWGEVLDALPWRLVTGVVMAVVGVVVWVYWKITQSTGL